MNIPKKLKYQPLVALEKKPEIIIFRNVRVFSGTDSKNVENQDVIVRNGEITEVRASGEVLPAESMIIEGEGKTLLPGLIDFHVHSTTSPAPFGFAALPDPLHNLQEFLFMGVTCIFDAGGVGGDLRKLQIKTHSGDIPGPRIFYCAGPLAAKNGYFRRFLDDFVLWPLNLFYRWRILSEVTNKKEIIHYIEKRIKEGTNAVKVYFDKFEPAYPPSTGMLTTELLRIIVDESHKRNLKVVVHISNAKDAMNAARCGIDALMHTPYQSRLTRQEAEELADIGIPITTTCAIVYEGVDISLGRLMPDQFDKKMEHSDLIAAMTGENGARNLKKMPTLHRFFKDKEVLNENLLQNIRLLFEAGVKFMAGTDGSMGGVIAGSSLHRELRYMAEAGIPNNEVLMATTSRPARFLDSKNSFGTIKPGQIADLLLVEGNPQKNIKDTTRIVQILRAGHPVKRLF